METVTMNIKGMTCGGCVKSVTEVLQKIDGISNIQVSLENNNAFITYNASQTNPARFKSAIEDAGFDVI